MAGASMSMPIRANAAESPGALPSTRMVPELARTKPSNIRNVVVLPAPFGPRNP